MYEIETYLLEVFNKSRAFFYQKENNKLQKSDHWERYDIKSFSSKALENFRKEGGLSHSLDDVKDTFSFKLYTEVVNLVSEEYLLANMSANNIGNCDRLIKFKNKLIDYNKLIHIVWYHIIENKILKNQNINSVCEIGSGFGSLAQLFISNQNNIKFISIDLPEANLMTSYFLKKNFPEKKFYFFNEYLVNQKLELSDYQENDIFILQPDLNYDEKIKIDLFINARSMMEMKFDTIKKYFKFIQRTISNEGFFVNINRYEKDTSGDNIKVA